MYIPIISVIIKPIKHLVSIASHHTAAQAVATFVSQNVVAVSVAGAVVVSGGAVGVVSVVNHNNGKPDTTQTQPNNPPDSKKTDPDAPTILVKDSETGETRAVSQNDIKKDPSLLNNVIKTPIASDYQSAGITPPSDPAIYDCVKVLSDEQTYYNVMPNGSGIMITDPKYCKTISDSSSNNAPSQPEVRYSHTTQTYINGNTTIDTSEQPTLIDGNGGRLCTGAGTRVGFNNSTTYYIGGSDTPTTPSRQYDMDCKRYEYVSNGNGAYRTPSGSTASGFYTFYALYQYQPTTFTYQRRIISCTIHTHQTNILDNNTGQYFDRDYDTPYGFTDTYPTSSVGYTGQEPCSFLRNNGTMTRVSVYATYDANNSWTIATSFFGINALYND